MSTVLLLNGSPHPNGCVFTALSEIARTLEAEGVGSEIFQIGPKPVRGCIACGGCRRIGSPVGKGGCVFKDDVCAAFQEAMRRCDALIVGSPVYYAGPAGTLCALLDRAFYSATEAFAGKPAACVVNCRRGGASAAFDRLNKYFSIVRMPIVSSQYWNSTHGLTPDEVRRDKEGLQTMRTLAREMAHLLKCREKAALPPPPVEPWERTNFIGNA